MSRAWWLLLVAAACSGARPGPGPGGPDAADRDGDGWTPREGDCDDRDHLAFPGAADRPGDGEDQDCDGADDAWLGAAALQAGDLVITEILADPLAVDPALAEWFEITNVAEVAVDLEGLLITDDEGDEAIVIGVPLPVPAGGAVALGGWVAAEVNGGASVSWSWAGEIGLSNVQDTLVLRSPVGEIVDRVAWDATYPSDEGRSLALNPELRDAVANDLATSWCLGQDPYGLAGYGTPGSGNPACPGTPGRPLGEVVPGELVITEVFHHPLLADGEDGEWIEITSRADGVIELFALTVEDAAGNRATIEDSVLIAPGELLVFAGSRDAASNGGLTPAWDWDDQVSLSNDADTVKLMFGTRVLDEVTWDEGEVFPDVEGASLSLDPARVDATDNDDGANWCAATTPFGVGELGTPAAPNPACP